MDRKDQLILQELQKNGKISNLELAGRINLSESSCLRRVKTLEEKGYLTGYAALVDQKMVGYPNDVLVRITLVSQDKQNLEAFESEIHNIPEVMECYLMSGDSDYLLRVVVSDARDYERLHSQHLTRLPGVDRVHSSFALRTVVKNKILPVR